MCGAVVKPFRRVGSYLGLLLARALGQKCFPSYIAVLLYVLAGLSYRENFVSDM
jgi:hypothetical protein